jgi:hypothetical protein
VGRWVDVEGLFWLLQFLTQQANSSAENEELEFEKEEDSKLVTQESGAVNNLGNYNIIARQCQSPSWSWSCI